MSCLNNKEQVGNPQNRAKLFQPGIHAPEPVSLTKAALVPKYRTISYRGPTGAWIPGSSDWTDTGENEQFQNLKLGY